MTRSVVDDPGQIKDNFGGDRLDGDEIPGLDADSDAGETGEAVQRLYRLGRLFAVGVRAGTMPLTATIALLAAPTTMILTVVIVVGVTVAWSAVYVHQLLVRPARWFTVVDACVLAMLCLSTHWTVSTEWLSHNQSWVLAFVSFACVGYQCHTEIVLGTAATVGVIGSLVLGTTSAMPPNSPSGMAFTTCWAMVAAALSRVQWILVRRGGRIADRQMAAAERARTAQHVADALRADERALANALHDTAATTLLMVGIGQANYAEGLLTAQAERDLRVLSTYGARLPPRSDLTILLRTAANMVALRVEFDAADELSLPTPVAAAIADAAAEALNNVVRHAKVNTVAIRVRGDDHRVNVDIVDQGQGFRLNEIATTRHGLRESIYGRMRSIGGRAHIATSVESGTRVRLEWTDA